MSTYWHLHCVDCDVGDDTTHINHGERAFAEVMILYPRIKDIFDGQRFDWIEPPTVMSYGSGPFYFMHDHDGHVVKIKSEYGEYLGDKKYERSET